MKIVILKIALWLVALTLQAQDTTLYERRVFVNNKGDSLLYRILFPEDYHPGEKYPLVLFMHGAGERGRDNNKQLTHGGALFLQPEYRKEYPSIVIFPQCPEDKYWVNINIRRKLFAGEDLDFEEVRSKPTQVMRLVMQLLDRIIREEQIDRDRLYLMGLSMGGFATLEMLTRWPQKFTAAVAICGGGNPKLAQRYSPFVSLWITHGAKDDVVPVKYSRRVYEALQSNGADVKYTEFPDANHNAWDPTFEIPELLPWLFSKSK